jgi:3-hydroxyacyl-CoA dehydrogenase
MQVTGHYVVQDGVAVVTLSAPPVNSLGLGLRRRIAAGLQAATDDPAVIAVVLAGAGGNFSAGADITEFGTPDALRAPNLRQLVRQVEDHPKPVVAAIEGNCLGGGLELALACHYRVAQADARVGLPEVKLGLLPGAGGTQRLPRLIGLEAALNVAASGEPVPASKLAKTPLLDAVVANGVLEAAVTLARKVVGEGSARPRARDRKVEAANVEAFCEYARGAVTAAFPQYPAPRAVIDAMQAGITDFAAGVAREAELFEQLLAGPVSKSLIHAFFAERAAAKVKGLPANTATRDIRKVAIIGAGTMGTGITLAFLAAGIPVTLLEVKQDALDRGVARIRETIEGQVKKGRLKPDKAASQLAALTPVLDYAALADNDLVVEAVFEDMGVKEQVFLKLDAVMKPGAILATNTSTLDVDHIAAITQRPGDVIGLHFFSPANIMKLLEVVRGAKTSPEVLATAMKLAKAIRKTAVVSGVCDGFIGNRMLVQYFRQAEFMLEEGATPQQVDRAIEKFGFAMGPFRMGDMAGNDVLWHIRKRQRVQYANWPFSFAIDRLCEAGRMGQKAGAGWYDYRSGERGGQPSRAVDEILGALRKERGLTPRRIPDSEIVDRLVLALVNEGAHILEEGIAQSASDIDVVYLTGYGFPVWRGGPMFQAELTGLYDVVQRMGEFARNPAADPSFWQPAPLLARLAAEGRGFSGEPA